ncbi:MAG: nucleotidyl transferase AbiEii/AbiGii toxin family protein [Acidobacteriota bacterium]
MSQFEANTLTAIVDRSGPVKVSFFGGLALNRIQDPDMTPDNGMQVASLLDIAATELATIQQRTQARDYEDIAAIMVAGITVSDALAAAAAVYGKQFNGALSLKGLTYFDEQLSPGTQEQLRTLAGQLQARTGVTGEGTRK